MDTDEQGRVLASFVNLCRAWPPLVIVDEAHNARTPLSFDTLKRFAPAFILELTATPATDPKSGSNVLVGVSARELRDATMIKLPVVVTEYGGDWTATVAGAVRERAMLEDLARQDGRGIRPIALYQAERKDGTVTPEAIRTHLIQNEGIAEDEIAITRQSAQSTTLCIQPDASPAAIDRLCERLPANQRQPVRDAYRQAVALRCPAERGETLTLPLLAWRQDDLILGEATAEELRHHGRFSARDCPPHDCDWSNDRQATTSEIDADAAGHLGISDARIRPVPQRALGEQWDRDWLVYWLRNMDRHPRSFRLPCPSAHGDWFYPDFLGRLTDTRLLVMEYKGGYLEPFDSRKRQMGLAWQRAMNGQGVFLWIGDSAETSRGRSIAQQIQAGLRGGWAAHTMPSGRRGPGSGG